MDKSTRLPGTLSLFTDSNEKAINITLEIPQQTIYLRSYRIEMATAADALAEKVLYLDLPIFNSNKMIDSNVNHMYLPILLDNAVVTHSFGLDIPVAMSGPLSERFKMRLLNSSFQPVSDLTHASFQFYLSEGRLS